MSNLDRALERGCVMNEEPQHDDACWEWCNHCTACGTGILYGSLCPAHENRVSPKTEGEA